MAITSYIGQVKIGDNYSPVGSTLYGICTTAAATAAKTITTTDGTGGVLEQFDGLVDGVTIHVKFINGNTANNPTLKVGKMTTSPAITNPNGTLTFAANSVITFTYDGTNWVVNASQATPGTVDQTYGNGTSTNAISAAGVKTALETLDVTNITGFGADKTLATLTETDGKIAATFQNISITKSQVSDLTTVSKTSAGLAPQLPNETTTTKYLRQDGTWAVPPNDDTHHQAYLITGASANAQSTVAGGTNDIFLNLVENSTVRSSHEIVGSGSVTVASDANGKITITGNRSGTVTSITPGDGLVNGSNTKTAITSTGTIKIQASGVTNDMLAGSIANDKLANSSITIAGTGVSLGGNIAAATLRANLGLSAALRFVGSTTTTMSDGYTGTPAGISIYTGTGAVTPAIGDVVIDSTGNAEYVCISESSSGYVWELLGRDSSWALDSAVIHNTLLSTKGDIIYASAANTPARLAIGTGNNKFLTISGGVPVWGTVGKSDVGLGNVTNHAQVTSLQWDSTNKKITYKVSEGTATDLLQFVQGSNITLTAESGKITIAGTANNAVSQTLDSTSTDTFPLLFATSNTTVTTATVTNGAKRNNSIYIQPSTGTITATKFSGDGSGLTNVTASSVEWVNVQNKVTAAKDTLGLVKTSSTVTSTSGLTAAPIINGIVYYKDTNTHNTAYLYATTSTGTTNVATATSDPYLTLMDGGAASNRLQLKGAGGATVSAKDGVITFTSTKYKSTGSANAVTSITLGYTVGTTANTDTVGTTEKEIGYVEKGILYIKSIKYGTTSVSTGVTTD